MSRGKGIQVGGARPLGGRYGIQNDVNSVVQKVVGRRQRRQDLDDVPNVPHVNRDRDSGPRIEDTSSRLREWFRHRVGVLR